jgi:lipoyl synthase
VPLPGGPRYRELNRQIQAENLHTVCQEAACPNVGDCWERGTATFMILGDTCTRRCGFCNVKTGKPTWNDPLEPLRVARSVARMGLKYAVVTSVDRDDLPDGGAAHFAATIRALRSLSPAPTVEVLTPDFRGRFDSLRTVVDAAPDVFNHNVETVPRLYASVRRGARLDRSLGLLAAAKVLAPHMTTKSGLMLGLGETRAEVVELLRLLREARVDVVTIGQYLRPSRENLPVVDWVPPEEFDAIRIRGEKFGFRHVFAGPFVRSSYRAEEFVSESAPART